MVDYGGSSVKKLIFALLVIGLISCGGDDDTSTNPNSEPEADPDYTPFAQFQLHSNNGDIKDENARTIILNGAITITHHQNGYQPYTIDDYRRLKSWGANYQSIRLFASVIGADGTPTYPIVYEKIDEMVANAKQVGIYTEFKLTMYSSEEPYSWKDLFLNSNNAQQNLIDGWKSIWTRYVNEPAVIGYDLINEPEQGELTTSSHSDFMCNYLNPLYQTLIDELHSLDGNKFALIQPALDEFDIFTGTADYYEYPCSIDRENVLYAPHLYAKLSYPYDILELSARLSRYTNEAQLHNAPLFIGEYGIPWNKSDDGNSAKETEYFEVERATVSLMDNSKIGFSRPWFADDNAEVSGIPQLNWALIKGAAGLSGDEREFITDIFCRPYPLAIAGELTGYNFDFANNEFVMNYQSDNSFGHTELFTAKSRHFSNSLVLQYNNSTFSLNTASNKFEIIDNPENIDLSNLSWNAENETIIINEWTTHSVDLKLSGD